MLIYPILAIYLCCSAPERAIQGCLQTLDLHADSIKAFSACTLAFAAWFLKDRVINPMRIRKQQNTHNTFILVGMNYLKKNRIGAILATLMHGSPINSINNGKFGVYLFGQF